MTTPQPATEDAVPDSAAGIEVDRTLTLWVHTETLWHSLEAAAGVALGRFKPGDALGPSHFHTKGHDLDAMTEWARAHGIPYTDERALHYRGTTGVVDLTSDQLTLDTTDLASASMRAFEAAARAHLQHSPADWTIRRVHQRQWDVVDHRDATIATRTTKKAAHAAIDDSPERRVWEELRAWYLGQDTDPRTRPLTTEEQAVIDRILAETRQR